MPPEIIPTAPKYSIVVPLHDEAASIRELHERLSRVMTGRYDINVAAVVAYKIHKAIPGSQFVVFDQSGHLPFYEEPEKFLRSVEAFLK